MPRIQGHSPPLLHESGKYGEISGRPNQRQYFLLWGKTFNVHFVSLTEKELENVVNKK